MKHSTCSLGAGIIACCLMFTAYSFSQGTWSQKSPFGQSRAYAAGFSIGTKGYIGTGVDNSGIYHKDFWEWDQTTDTWTQKANYGGAATAGVGFSVGTKGYVGINGNTDFWEWDQGTNSWTQKASFTGPVRGAARGFSIGTKGYVGTGVSLSGTTYYNDFWEWDQGSNSWSQKASLPGAGRYNGVGFSIGTKGYIGTGTSGMPPQPVIYYKDFWEWDQATNLWVQKANFGGTARYGATGFAIGAKGYIGTGGGDSTFWEWNQANNTWTQKANFGGAVRNGAVGFSIGSKGYIGAGDALNTDFWEYAPDSITGVNELSNAINISVFPNPTTGKIIVNSSSNFNSIEIYNVQGEKVYSSSQMTNAIDLSEQQVGVYFMQVKTSEGVLTKKIIVQR